MKLNKLNENITKDISDQKNRFEELKKKKLDHQNSENKSKILEFIYFILVKIKKFLSKTSFKQNDENTNYSSTPSAFNEEELTREIIYNKQKDNVIQSMMLKEIEDFIEKSMKEMHVALSDLKLSFEEEIESVDGIYFLI